MLGHRNKYIFMSIIAIIYILIMVFENSVNIEAFTHNWTNSLVSKEVGIMGYLAYDISDNIRAKFENLDEGDTEIFNKSFARFSGNKFSCIELRKKKPNIIVVQMESVDGVATSLYLDDYGLIMPNFNRIAEQSILFSNAFDQTGEFTTSDAEFMALTSLYPLNDKAVFSSYEVSGITSLPKLLDDNGYYTFSVHGYKSYFWNRDKAHPALGFQDSFFIEDLDDTDKLGWGISDKSVIKQAVEIGSKSKRPFYSHIILLTNHNPYRYVSGGPISNTRRTVEDYINSVNYVDEALGLLFDLIHEKNLIDKTIVLIFSDHNSYILNEVYDYSKIPCSNTSFDRKIPFILYTGENSGVNDTVVGQIDIAPLILQCLKIDVPKSMLGGKYIDNNEGIIMKDASFIKKNANQELFLERIDFDTSLLSRYFLLGGKIGDE